MFYCRATARFLKEENIKPIDQDCDAARDLGNPECVWYGDIRDSLDLPKLVSLRRKTKTDAVFLGMVESVIFGAIGNKVAIDADNSCLMSAS